MSDPTIPCPWAFRWDDQQLLQCASHAGHPGRHTHVSPPDAEFHTSIAWDDTSPRTVLVDPGGDVVATVALG